MSKTAVQKHPVKNAIAEGDFTSATYTWEANYNLDRGRELGTLSPQDRKRIDSLNPDEKYKASREVLHLNLAVYETQDLIRIIREKRLATEEKICAIESLPDLLQRKEACERITKPHFAAEEAENVLTAALENELITTAKAAQIRAIRDPMKRRETCRPIAQQLDVMFVDVQEGISQFNAMGIITQEMSANILGEPDKLKQKQSVRVIENCVIESIEQALRRLESSFERNPHTGYQQTNLPNDDRSSYMTPKISETPFFTSARLSEFPAPESARISENISRDPSAAKQAFLEKYAVKVLSDSQVALRVPRGISELAFLEEVQALTQAVYGRNAIKPDLLKNWSRRMSMKDYKPRDQEIAVDLKVANSNNLTSEEVADKGWFTALHLPTLAMAHAAFFIATGKDAFGGDVVRAQEEGNLYFSDSDGLGSDGWIGDASRNERVYAFQDLPYQN